MKYRTATLLAATDVGATGTRTEDITISQVISRLCIRFGVIVPSTPTPIEVAAANITKIEVVDGSDVLFSLSGIQAQAMDFYDSGRVRHNGGSYVPAWELIANFYINFGRKLWDKELALDPKRFNNPQIKITFNEDLAIAGVDTNSLSILADVFDEKVVSPVGFLMNKQLKSYTPSASTWEYIDLPKDFPYRKLMIEARQADAWLGKILAHIKVSENNDAKVPFDLPNTEFEAWLKDNFPRYREHIVADLDATTGLDLYHTPTQGIVLGANAYCASDVLDAIPFGYVNKFKTGDNIGYQVVALIGDVPHGCLAIPLGDQADMDDWYDPAGKAIQLQIKGGSAPTGTFYACTQQLRRY